MSGAWTTAIAPGGMPLLGHVLPLRFRPLDFLARLPHCGDLVEVRLGPRRAYLACHPDLVQQLLRDSRTFDKGGPLFDKARPLTGDGLAASGWATHRRQRRLMQPAFHIERMAGYAKVMCEEIDSTLDSWQAGRVLDINREMHALTARIIVRTLFSTQIDDRAVAEIQHCFPIFTRGLYKRMVAPFGLVEKLPTSGNRRFEQALARMHSAIEETIRGYRKMGVDHGDLMSTLVDARDKETGEQLSGAEIHDHVVSLLLGGSETTGNALSWTFHLLGGHPEAEERIRSEVDGVLDGRPPRYEDLTRLGYTRRVITESLRLYPSGWLLSRSTTKETELAGVRLLPDTTVLFSLYAIGRNPALFTDAERFDPDRWRHERAAAIPRSAQLSFGAGSRKCIGDNFGMVEVMLTLAAVISRWRLSPVPGSKVQPKPRASLGTGTLLMIPEPRRSRVP